MKTRILFPIIIALLMTFACTKNTFAQDAGILAIIAPPNNSILIPGNGYTVTLRVMNFDTNNTLSSCPVIFGIGLNAISATVGSIAPGDSMDFTFPSQLFINNVSSGLGQAATLLTGDVNTLNDVEYGSYSYFVGIEGNGTSGQSGLAMNITTNIASQTLDVIIESKSGSDNAEMFITSMDGKQHLMRSLVLAKGDNAQSISILNLASGAYIFTVKTGTEMMQKKFLK